MRSGQKMPFVIQRAGYCQGEKWLLMTELLVVPLGESVFFLPPPWPPEPRSRPPLASPPWPPKAAGKFGGFQPPGGAGPPWLSEPRSSPPWPAPPAERPGKTLVRVPEKKRRGDLQSRLLFFSPQRKKRREGALVLPPPFFFWDQKRKREGGCALPPSLFFSKDHKPRFGKFMSDIDKMP